MSQPDEFVRVCGFLNIEETEFSGSFCRRYFILDIPNRKLAYYIDDPTNLPEAWKGPVGEIYLQYINKVADARNTRPKVQFCFAVSVAGRQYFLQAESMKSMNYWIDAINGASKISVSMSDVPDKGKEWHAADLTHTSYVTEIAGGVVCKLPLQTHDESDSGSEGEEEESHSSLSFRLSPTSFLSRQHNVSTPEPVLGDSLRGEAFSKLAPIKTGYAVKQGAVRRNWKRRFFILHEGGLSYFKSEQDKQPIRTLSVTDISEARQAEGANVNRDNLLEIVTSKRVFYVQCDSPADMRSWIQEITALVSKLQKKSMQEEGGKQEPGDKTKNYSQSIWV
ncbi:pleckstrin homology domain-containing family A member 2-like [Babylonia areolata]|uniref:pleckstrin homology domain-containing family A member 2-like n=1 Tax=Babylonia areolata TaxID=304850 RepID=UPI003FD14970